MASLSTAVNIISNLRQYFVYGSYVVLAGGMLGNILNLIIFSQLKRFRENRWSFYFIVESIVGLIFIASSIINTTARLIIGTDFDQVSLVWCRLRLILNQGLGLTIFFIIPCAAVDQFFSTSYLFNLRNFCTLKLVRSLVIITSCLWYVHSITFSCFLNIRTSAGCIITNANVSRYSIYFFYPILYGSIQIIIAFLFSLLAFRNVRRLVRRQIPIDRRRMDQQMTAMILTRVAFFIVYALPYSIYRVYSIGEVPDQSKALQYAIIQLTLQICILLFTMNFSASFYIFIITCARYRNQAKYVLVKICWARLKRWTCHRNNGITPLNTLTTSSNDELD
ncbi:unnamed protein product [Adineta ricciae]|uniref:G-protein coupled receptors family 1 profile domain-containing protein n=1 Tax=Adineta ricciae TaxID=249248 RepID=A0A814VII1_ADIRI|nr:unnamed protein product [Adineta ricciae]CAF1191240.1 unnamed protein product [Adineta ricciae]